MQGAWKKDENQNKMKAKIILAARRNTRDRAAKIGESSLTIGENVHCVAGAEMPAPKLRKAKIEKEGAEWGKIAPPPSDAK